MFIVHLQIVVFGEHGFLVLLQTDIPAPVNNRAKQVVLLVTTAIELVPHPVVNIEEVVRILTCVLHQLWWEGPAAVTRQYRVVVVYQMP